MISERKAAPNQTITIAKKTMKTLIIVQFLIRSSSCRVALRARAAANDAEGESVDEVVSDGIADVGVVSRRIRLVVRVDIWEESGEAHQIPSPPIFYFVLQKRIDKMLQL